MVSRSKRRQLGQVGLTRTAYYAESTESNRLRNPSSARATTLKNGRYEADPVDFERGDGGKWTNRGWSIAR